MKSIHYKKELYKCTICQENFTRHFNLRSHMKKIHKSKLDVDKKPEQNKKIANIKVCQICEKTFGDIWKLRRHEKTHINNGEL